MLLSFECSHFRLRASPFCHLCLWCWLKNTVCYQGKLAFSYPFPAALLHLTFFQKFSFLFVSFNQYANVCFFSLSVVPHKKRNISQVKKLYTFNCSWTSLTRLCFLFIWQAGGQLTHVQYFFNLVRQQSDVLQKKHRRESPVSGFHLRPTGLHVWLGRPIAQISTNNFIGLSNLSPQLQA